MCPQGSAFFGLTPNNSQQYRLNLFNHLHQIIFHGNGGYDFETVYNLPIWLRKYIFKEIKDYYAKVNKPPEEQGKTNLVNPDGKVNVPEFAKASKQYKGKSSYKQLLFLIFIIKHSLNG